MPNTYTGWPVIPSGDARLTVIEPVPGRRFTVLAGPVATVLDWLIRRFHAEVEPIDQGILDDYGYNYRKVRGSDSWSNHASGTAVDLNATKHPFKTRADQNFSPAQIAAVRQILADATINGQQVVRWLDANDPMHFEINHMGRGGTPEAVAALAARLTSQPAVEARPEPTAPTAPGFPLPAGSYFGPKSGPGRSVSGYFSNREDLRRWQARMAERGWRIAADGLYGPDTKRVATGFQREKGLSVDGLIGPDTWAAAWTTPVTNA